MKDKEFLVCMGLFTVLGSGVGWAGESHANEMARKRAITVEACIKAYPDPAREDVVTQGMVDCIENGWVGGAEVDTEELPLSQGSPLPLLTGYVEQQRSAAAHTEATPIIWWGVGGFIVSLFAARSVDKSIQREKEKTKQANATADAEHVAAAQEMTGD